MHPRFATHVDQAVASLRARLLADVMATAERDQRRPGIRRDWGQLVRRLAELRSAIGPEPVQTPAHTTEST
jgi:hypothetical protein